MMAVIITWLGRMISQRYSCFRLGRHNDNRNRMTRILDAWKQFYPWLLPSKH